MDSWCLITLVICLINILPTSSHSSWQGDTLTSFKYLFGSHEKTASKDGFPKEKDDTVEKLEETNLTNELPNAKAQVGKVFTFNIPKHVFSGVRQLMVNEAGSKDLPQWLYFDVTTQSFLGLPTAMDQGIVYIEITGIDDNETKSNQKIFKEFLIKVSSDALQQKYEAISPQTEGEQWPDALLFRSEPSNIKHMQYNHGCDLFDSVWKATLLLDVTLSKMLAQERVRLLHDFAQFLGRDIEKLNLGPKRSSSITQLLDTKVVLAGPGNTNIISENIGIELSWVIGCGDSIQPQDFAKVMEHNMNSKGMHDALKYPVIGWHVSENKSNFLKRKRRQAGFKTPVPTPVLSTGLPTAHTSSINVIQSTSEVIKSSSKTLQTSVIDIAPTRTVLMVESTILPSSTQTFVILPSPTEDKSSEVPVATLFPSTPALNISDFITASSSNISELFPSLSPSLDMSSMSISNTSILPSVNSSEFSNISMHSVMEFSESTELFPTMNLSGIKTEEIMSSHFDMNSSFVINMTMTSPIQELNFSLSEYLTEPSIIVQNSTVDIYATNTLLYTDNVSNNLTEPSIIDQNSTVDIYATNTLLYTDNSSNYLTEPSIIDHNATVGIYATNTLLFTENSVSVDSVLNSFLLSSQGKTLLHSPTQLYESTVDMSNATLPQSVSPSSTLLQSSSAALYSSLGETSPSTVTDDTPSIDITLFTEEVSTVIATSPISMSELGSYEVLPSSFLPATDLQDESMVSAPLQTSLFTVDFVANGSSVVQSSLGTLFISNSVMTDVTVFHSMVGSMTSVQPTVSEVLSSKVSSDQSEYSDLISSLSIESSEFESSQQTIGLTVVPSSVLIGPSEIESSQQTIEHTVVSSFGVVSSQIVDFSNSDMFTITSSTVLYDTSFNPETTTLILSENIESSITATSYVETVLSVGNSDELTVIDTALEMATSEFPSSQMISRPQELSTEILSFPTSVSSYDLMTSYETFSTSRLISSFSSVDNQVTMVPSYSMVPSVMSTETFMQESSSVLSMEDNSFLSSIDPTARLQTTVSIPIFALSTVETEHLSTSMFPMETPVADPSSVLTSSVSVSLTLLSSSSRIETFTTTMFSPATATTIISMETSVFQPNPVTSPGASMSVELSTTAIPNNGPILANPIDKVVTKLGQSFVLQVPADTFYDYEDGNTKNLNLSLVDLQGKTLPSNSWVLFNAKTQTIYGLPLSKDVGPFTAEYVLVATDSSGLSARDVLEVTIITASLKDMSQIYRLELNFDYRKFVESTQNTLDLVKAIGNFHGGEKERAIAVSNISSGSLVLEYTNTTISKKECENETIRALLETMTKDGKVTPAFEEALAALSGSGSPVVRNVTLELLGVCASSNDTVIPLKPGPVVADTVTWLAILITLLVLILLIVLIIFLYCYCHRRKRDGDSQMIDNEKLIYSKNRKPVLLENEMEMSDISRKPKKPIIMDTDYGLYPESFGAPRGYTDPPPYRTSGPRGYDNPAYRDDTRSPPPSYGGPSSSSSNPPPPAYRLPPPYVAFPGHSDV